MPKKTQSNPAKPTAGPWFIQEYENRDLYAIVPKGNDDEDPNDIEPIADVHGKNLEGHANAVLMASAPDLFAACNAFVAMAYPCVGQIMSQQSVSDIQRHREVALAAINKATSR